MMTISTDLITGKEYPIPQHIDDSSLIEKFIGVANGRKVLVVQGLGFVGAVMAVVCANASNEDYLVIGVDLPSPTSFWKVCAINEGRFPIVAEDPEIEQLFKKSIEKGNFLATCDQFAYSVADVVIVDVNLDVDKQSAEDGSLRDFDVSLAGFKNAINAIALQCKKDALILVETTVPPGTTEKVVLPILRQGLEARGLDSGDIKVGHSYERVMPGPNYVSSIRNFPRVYSGCDDSSASAIQSFLSTIINTETCELTCLDRPAATEMAKVLENSYRAMNISFMVEWSRFAEEAGVDLFSIVDAIRIRPTHANLMYPGLGVGGYCLTKDPLLASWSRKTFFGGASLQMSEASVSKNDQMPLFAFSRMSQVFGSVAGYEVLCLGVSYRGDVGDTRYSPVFSFVEELERAGATVSLHDPYVGYWEERNRGTESLDVLFAKNFDLIVIGAGHSLYTSDDFVASLFRLESTQIFDPLGLLSDEQITMLQAVHQVTVLGRGDI